MPDKNITFEEAYAELEKITEKLSGNDLPLDEAILLYEEGMKLSGICAEMLEKAKQKIENIRGGEA